MALLRIVLGACAASALLTSCHGSISPSTDAPAPGLPGIKMATSAVAAGIVERARALHADAPSLRPPKLAGRVTPQSFTAVTVSDADAAHVDGVAIRPHFSGAATTTTAVVYPSSSDGQRSIGLKSGESVALALLATTHASAEYASGFVVYPGALRVGGDALTRPTRDGFEDYFYFEQRPARSIVEYSIALPPSVAGLRLSSNVLELVDAHGTPLVHAAPPFLVDSANKHTPAALSVAGCAVDESAQPSFRRTPTAPGATNCRVSVTWDDTAVRYPAVLDPDWSTGGTMPIAVAEFDVQVLRKQTPQQVVVFGGSSGSLLTNVTQFFDADSGAWSVGPPLNVARGDGASVYFNTNGARDGDRVLAIGGVSGTVGNSVFEASTELLSRDGAGNWSWSRSASMQSPREVPTATLLGTKVLIAGGVPNNNGPTASCELYDTTTGTFISPPPPAMQQARAQHRAVLSPDGQSVLVVGGYDASFNLTQTAEMFIGGNWVTAPPLPTQQWQPNVVQLADGRAMFAGSWHFRDPQQDGEGTSQVELFTFASSPPYGGWSSAESFNSPSTLGPITLLGNGAVLLGPLLMRPATAGAWVPTTDVRLYDPNTSHWSNSASASPHDAGGSATVTKSDGSKEGLVFGGYSSYDSGTSSWTYTNTTEIFTPASNGQSCSAGPECATGTCVSGTCQPQGFPITLDATALSNKGVVVTGYSPMPLDTTQARALRLPAGSYTLQPYAGLPSSAAFTVKPDGTLDFDPALDGLLVGRGTTNLKVYGKPINITTQLTQRQLALVAYHYVNGVETDQLPFSAQTTQPFMLLPVPSFGYGLDVDGPHVADLTFSIDLSGYIHIPPDKAGFARGEGTTTLLITGQHVAITVPAGLGAGSLGNGIALPAGQTTDIFLLPYGGGSQFTLQIAGQTATFTVNEAGNIIADPELINALGLHGDGAPACTQGTATAEANAWDFTALSCGGPQEQVDDGITYAPTPSITPTSRLAGLNRPPPKLPRFRRAAGGDPVLGDGEFVIDRIDARLAGQGLHYEFRRSYRSGLENDGPLGPGWDHNYDQRIIGTAIFDQDAPNFDPTTAGDIIGANCDKTVNYQDGTGSYELFTETSWHWGVDFTQSFAGQNGDSQLEHHTNFGGVSYWRLTRSDGTVLIFDRAGFLSSITDLAGNVMSFAWDRAVAPAPPRPDCAAGGFQAPGCKTWLFSLIKSPIGQRRRLASVSDASRTVHYLYSQSNPQYIYPNDRLSCISLTTNCSSGVLTAFGYDSASRLTQVTRGVAAVNPSESYSYHSLATDTSFCLASSEIPGYCHRLCDPASPTAACNFDYTDKVLGRCASLTCDDGTGTFTYSCTDPAHWDETSTLTRGNQHMCCTGTDPVKTQQLCASFLWDGPTCVDGCENEYQCLQIQGTNKYAFWSEGTSRELNNDITDVYDDKGNLVVHNTYGEDRTVVSFDRVTAQQLTSASTDNTVTFEYHDLAIEQQVAAGNAPPVYNDTNGAQLWSGTYSTPDPTGLVQQYTLAPAYFNVLCPATAACPPGQEFCGLVDYGAPYVASSAAGNAEAMTFAVRVNDLHGLTRVQYLDRDFKVLRDVTAQTNEVTNYEYRGAQLRGIQAASGVRACLERDSMARVSQASVVPAPGYGGSTVTQATTLTYQANGALTDVVRDWFGTPVKTHYGLEAGTSRVLEIDQDVKAGALPLQTFFDYSGESPGYVLETPTKITYPNHRVDTFSQFDASMGGPKSIVIDSTNPTPERRYAVYDGFGRVSEAGEVGRYAQRYAYTDGSNVFRLTSAGHSLDGGVTWVDEPVQSHVVDGTSVVDSLQELTRTTNLTYVGRFPTQKDLISTHSPTGTTAPATQTSCFNYGADGRLDAEILPMGNGVKYTYGYDSSGTSIVTQKGFGIDTSGAWATNCRNRPAPQNDPGLGLPEIRKYAPGGFLATTIDESLIVQSYVTDGFGRILQIAMVQNQQHPDPVATQQFGYDVAGHRIWEALRTPGSPYGRPTLPDASVLAYVEYDYDLGGRVIAQRTHVIETGETLTKTFVYDDVAATQTITDRGVTTTAAYDGRGRMKSTTLPDGSTTTVVHGLGLDTETVQTNSKGNVVRTYNYDTRGLLLNVQTATGQLLYQATYNDDGDQLIETRAGMGPTTWAYDSFGRLVTETRTQGTSSAPVSATSTYEFDGNDRVITYYDSENPKASGGVPWRMTFTGGDAPLTITDTLLRAGRYTYSSANNWPHTLPLTVTEPNTRRSSFAYDSLGRIVDLYNGDCGLNRNPWECPAPLASQRHMTYDNRGNVSQVDAPSPRQSVYLTYDSLGRVIDDKVGPDSLVHHAYLDQGRTQQTQVTYGASLATMTHHYDNMDRLHTVELTGQATPLATYNFGVGVGGPLSLAYSNGATATYGYDDKLRQNAIDVTFGSTPVVSQHEAFGADSIARLRWHKIGTKSPATDVFQVDQDGRLMQENPLVTGILSVPTSEITNNDPTVTANIGKGTTWRQYTIDTIGNIKQRRMSSATLVHTVDKLSRLTKLGTTSMTIDSRDNLQGLQGNSTQFTFDQFTGTPTTASVGTATSTFTYDALDRRRKEHRSSDNSDHFYVWDDKQLVAHGTANSMTLDVPGDDIDEHIVSIDQMGSGSKWFYHQAPDQSVLAATGSTGLVEAYTYTALGEVSFWNASGSSITKSAFGNMFQFQGQVYDAATATYSMRARQYQPAWGRFVSPDPLGAVGGPSLYAFAGSSPLDNRDPLGLLRIRVRQWIGHAFDAGQEDVGGPFQAEVVGHDEIEFDIDIGGDDDTIIGPTVGDTARRKLADVRQNLGFFTRFPREFSTWFRENHHVPNGHELGNAGLGAGTGLLEGFTGLPAPPGDHTDEFRKQQMIWRTPGVMLRLLLHLPQLPEPAPALVPVEGGLVVPPAAAPPMPSPNILMAKSTGSYTNTHASGKTYSGKGSQQRSQKSGRREARLNNDPHIATDWTPAKNTREAFKQESRRIDAQGGINSPSNYNQRESPGKRFRIQDGEVVP